MRTSKEKGPRGRVFYIVQLLSNGAEHLIMVGQGTDADLCLLDPCIHIDEVEAPLADALAIRAALDRAIHQAQIWAQDVGEKWVK